MKQAYIPKQHGAWSMLIVPFLFGLAAIAPVAGHALLFVAWLLVYLCSYPLLQWIRTGKRQHYAKPLLIYGVLLAASGIPLLIRYPRLGWLVAACIPLFAVNCYYARINRERTFLNDLVAIVQFSLIVFAVYEVGGGRQWADVLDLFGLSLVYFTGTIFYVKTIIRERNNPVVYGLSIAYHLAAAIAAGFVSIWLAVPFAVLLIRAIAIPRTAWTVKRTGMMEVGFSAMMVVFVFLFG